MHIKGDDHWLPLIFHSFHFFSVKSFKLIKKDFTVSYLLPGDMKDSVDLDEVKKYTNIVGINIVNAWNKREHKPTKLFNLLIN